MQMDARGGCWGKSQTLLNQCLYHFNSLLFPSLPDLVNVFSPLPVILLFTVMVLCSLTHQLSVLQITFLIISSFVS